MKTLSLLTALLALTFAAGSFAADETAAKEGCKMMKKEPAPEPACCCQKMMAKTETPAKAADLDSLIDKMKAAKGDQVLDTFAAVLNQIMAERKAVQEKAPEGATPAAPPAHQH
ncbi:MAG: hypothetical protein ABJF10_08985 [Chthoniobacter sp.]|uniref:hypothetical protein n=1 Tax=Chthoniobacter sp. TaxID=2510640 RepID=UPI0032AE7E4E